MLDLVQLTDMAKIERYFARVSEWVSKLTAPLFTAILGGIERACRSLQTFTYRLVGSFPHIGSASFLDSAEFGSGMYWMLLER
jgi:hypothetical protein